MQAQFNALAASLGGENAHFAFFYDESLSHLIYAGCDIIAVPSMFEPCGLTQVIRLANAALFPALPELMCLPTVISMLSEATRCCHRQDTADTKNPVSSSS